MSKHVVTKDLSCEDLLKLIAETKGWFRFRIVVHCKMSDEGGESIIKISGDSNSIAAVHGLLQPIVGRQIVDYLSFDLLIEVAPAPSELRKRFTEIGPPADIDSERWSGLEPMSRQTALLGHIRSFFQSTEEMSAVARVSRQYLESMVKGTKPLGINVVDRMTHNIPLTGELQSLLYDVIVDERKSA